MRMRMRGGAALGVVLAASLTLSACASGSSNTSSSGTPGASNGAPTGSITVNGSEPENPLIPTSTNETGGGNVVDAMWTGLVKYDVKTGAPINAMAESITSTDFINWTIKIKSGWTFQDGTPVTSKSFVDAWNYGAFGPNAQQNQYFFEPILGYKDVSDAKATVKTMSGLKVVDDTTFTVQMSAPNSVFPVQVGYSAFDPMPASFFADPKAFASNPIGNGPFKFVSRTPSQSIKLTAYDAYKGDKPKVKDVEFKIYQSLDAAYADVVANNLDVIDSIPSAALIGDKWKTELAGRQVAQPVAVFQSIALPFYDPKFKNPNLIKALSEAIDRTAVIKVAFAGNRQPADGWVVPGTDGYTPNVCGDTCVFNPDQAKKDLAAAGGWTGVLTLAYNADGGHKTWVDATCVSIKNTLGIDCQGKPYPEFGPFRKAINAKQMTGMFRTGWQADYPSIQNYLEPLYATGASANDGSYSNPDFDAALKAAAALPLDQANKKYAEAEKLLASNVPVIPMWFGQLNGGWSTKVSNVAFNWQGRVDLSAITANAS
jgi:oligopeptide transport system substrate-binding protein